MIMQICEFLIELKFEIYEKTFWTEDEFGQTRVFPIFFFKQHSINRSHKVLDAFENKRQGTPGFEPGTSRSAVECSTTELYPR